MLPPKSISGHNMLKSLSYHWDLSWLRRFGGPMLRVVHLCACQRVPWHSEMVGEEAKGESRKCHGFEMFEPQHRSMFYNNTYIYIYTYIYTYIYIFNLKFSSPASSHVFLNLKKKQKKRETHGKSKSKTSKPKKKGSKINWEKKERQKGWKNGENGLVHLHVCFVFFQAKSKKSKIKAKQKNKKANRKSKKTIKNKKQMETARKQQKKQRNMQMDKSIFSHVFPFLSFLFFSFIVLLCFLDFADLLFCFFNCFLHFSRFFQVIKK